MTPAEMNVAIAEAVGWKWRITYNGVDGSSRERLLPPSGDLHAEIPDFAGSLDCMHEAYKSLLFTKRMHYRSHLREIIGREAKLPKGEQVAWEFCIDATAPQRAEAFLRTLGKFNPPRDE